MNDTGASPPSDLSVADAAKLTLSSKAFGADAKAVANAAVKVGQPGATGFDIARLTVAIGNIAAKLGGIAAELGEAIPLLGAMITIMEIGQSMALSWQRGELAKKAAAREHGAWGSMQPSGAGGALVAADLPPAFDELLIAWGTGRPTGPRGTVYPGGGATLAGGLVRRRRLARDDSAAGAVYIDSFMRSGQSLAPVIVREDVGAFQLGASLPSPKHGVTSIESYVLRLGKIRRGQRLKSEAAGSALLQAQMIVCYGAALALSQAPGIDMKTWVGETHYVQQRALAACWLTSALNSEPEGLKLRAGLLLGPVRSLTNARWGALQAAAASPKNIKGK